MPTPTLDLRDLPRDEWPDKIKVGEVALLFRVNPKTVRNWTLQGKLDSIRTLGNQRLFEAEDIWKLYHEGND